MPYSILIVEDDLTFATMLKTWLGKICVCRIKTVFLYLHG